MFCLPYRTTTKYATLRNGQILLFLSEDYFVLLQHIKNPYVTRLRFSSPFRPAEILIRASDGASDYGNKFGEPVLTGFMRSFGQIVDGERIEWLKPIMFSGGLGQLPAEGRAKVAPEPGMLLAKVGGPAYRIGVGGGAASSMQVSTCMKKRKKSL